MKKILNDVDSVEAEMIQGLVKSAPKMLRKLDYGTIVVRANKKEGKVALVSGGGSGHDRTRYWKVLKSWPRSKAFSVSLKTIPVIS